MAEQGKSFKGVAGRGDRIEHSQLDTKLTTTTTPRSALDSWGTPATEPATSSAQASKDNEKH
jgi:hypothetical protein